MNPLRTTVVMKTDISGSTSRFRQLLAADLQTLLGEHRDFLARQAEEHGGRIIKAAGDGYWLEFAGVTAAAKAAMAMQEALRLTQLNRGDDRLSIRIVITLGDIAVQDGDFIGDALALATRVEAITPADEIYLTAAARLALTSAAEVQPLWSTPSRSRALPSRCRSTESSSGTARAFCPTPTFFTWTSMASANSWMLIPAARGSRAAPRHTRWDDPQYGTRVCRYDPL
jgi:class 3 adenylate cyclase